MIRSDAPTFFVKFITTQHHRYRSFGKGGGITRETSFRLKFHPQIGPNKKTDSGKNRPTKSDLPKGPTLG
jgi:hypothetical protein